MVKRVRENTLPPTNGKKQVFHEAIYIPSKIGLPQGGNNQDRQREQGRYMQGCLVAPMTLQSSISESGKEHPRKEHFQRSIWNAKDSPINCARNTQVRGSITRSPHP